MNARRLVRLFAVAICGLAALGVAAPVSDAVPPVWTGGLSDVRSGDLVFREGVGWRADAVRLASRFRLTHVGVVQRTAAGVMVIDAEPPEAGRRGMVRRVTLFEFASEASANGIEFYRLNRLSRDRAAAFARSAQAYAVAGTPFDDGFDLRSADAVYCTELVWRALDRVGMRFRPVTTRIDLGVLGGDYMTPADLIVASGAEPVPAGRRASGGR